MRIAPVLTVALALTGCASDWKAFGIDTACREVVYFPDQDGDGWGLSTDPGTVSCDPPEAGAVRNNRDCDDEDASVTGRIGSLCPSQLVAQTEPADFVSVSVAGSEWVLMHAETDLVWAAAAEQACGAFGWGGSLATFDTQAQLREVLGALGDFEIYAAFVGFHPTERTFGAYDEEGDWVDAATGPSVVPLCSCMGATAADDNQPGCGDAYTTDLRYLAVVRDGRHGATFNDANWCLGTPDEALPPTVPSEAPAYERLFGHFICERPIPTPSDWDLATLASDAE